MKSTFWPLLVLLLLISACGTAPEEDLTEEDEEKKEIVYNIPDGFELEILYSPNENNDGSWVSLAEGENGMFYASDQNGNLYQFKIPAAGQVLDSTLVDTVPLNIGHAHGLLWAFNSLYVSVNDRWEDGNGNARTEHGSGVYRLQDTDADGQLDKLTMLLKLEGSGEHGPHSLVPGPDGNTIYFIAGNHTLIPDVLAKNSRLPYTWDEDNLFPAYLDARGHANDIKAPGGWIARFDPEGKNWELVAAGFRNAFDMAFNTEGELFAFDADMEWDIGMPWYRPIRICHVTSGSEFGWRTGSGKWPTYYPDNLPAVVNLGQGSPTGVVRAADLQLPDKYRNGLLVFDWSFGTAYFVDIQPEGSSYTGTIEEFFSGTPLPLTDAVAGADGALYFATGGRKLESHFYRLRYTGETTAGGQLTAGDEAAQLRSLRHELESYHNRKAPEAIPQIWENLSHPDRFVRYAARIALEHQSVSVWKNRLAQETDSDRILQASVALARVGSKDVKNMVYEKLVALNWAGLDRPKQLDWIRAVGLVAMRLGPPSAAQKAGMVQTLNAGFPSDDYALDREIGQLLVYFGDPEATAKCIALLEKHTREKTITHPTLLSEEVSNRSEDYGPLILEVLKKMPPTEAIFYGTLLSHAENGWTDDLREKYYGWFYEGLNAAGGLSFKPFLENIRRTAMHHVPDSLQEYYEKMSGIYQPGEELANLPQPEGPGMEYNAGDIHGILGRGLKEYKGDIAEGKRIYQAALCSSCHRIRGEGGTMGPDLTQLHTRFDQGDLVTAIFSPNDEISDQYSFTLFYLKDDKKMAGKVLSEDGDKVRIIPNPFNMNYSVEIPKADIIKSTPSPISPMPPNLLNRLNDKEITALFAYIMSGGDEEYFYYGGTKGLEEEQ